ncbi:hypothetical protein [Planctomicrobium sp. SH527]|uniref:hypothetical protein n=1 Tax=Planctomicrobium sp. SH527 TaxID=3448123 RepID=UPI003F5C2A1D
MSFRRYIVSAAMIFAACSSIVSAQETAPAADAIKLRYQFQVGQVVRYSVTMNDDYKIQVGATVDEPYSHQNSTKSYRVKSVNPDGSAVLELTIESAQLEIFQNGEKMAFDSTKPAVGERQAVFLALDALVGKPHLQVTINPVGAVSDYKAMVAHGQVPSDPTTAAFDVLFPLPENAMKVGESWKDDFIVNIALEEGSSLQKQVKMQRLNTLKSFKDGIAEIDVKTRSLTVLEGPTAEMQMLRRLPKGTVVIDTKQGLLVGKSFSQDNRVTNFDGGASLIQFRQKQDEKMIPGASAATGAKN